MWAEHVVHFHIMFLNMMKYSSSCFPPGCVYLSWTEVCRWILVSTISVLEFHWWFYGGGVSLDEKGLGSSKLERLKINFDMKMSPSFFLHFAIFPVLKPTGKGRCEWYSILQSWRVEGRSNCNHLAFLWEVELFDSRWNIKAAARHFQFLWGRNGWAPLEPKKRTPKKWALSRRS